MRVGIISDVHANWPALEAALAVFDREGVDRIFCLGDIIGYYTEPAECIEEMMDREIDCIRGNHERYLLGQELDGINKTARQAIEYTRTQLDEHHLAFIEGLSNTMRVRDYFLLVHGSPRHRDEYMLYAEQVYQNFDKLERDYSEFRLCFYGHTHLPMVIAREQAICEFHQDTRVPLDPKATYMINPGSVGQPRDRCPKACFLLYDTDRHEVHFYRREYDLKVVQARVHEVGLDPRLAQRLTQGR